MSEAAAAPAAESTPAAPAPAAPAPAAEAIIAAAPAPAIETSDWRSGIVDEALRGEAAIANYASLDDFVKGHMSTKALASSKIVAPGESEESRKAFGDALRPQDAAAYEISVAEGMPTEFADAAREKFFAMGLPPHWAKELVDFNNEFIAGELAKAEAASAEDVAQFKKDYGTNYDAQLAKVGVMLKSAGIDLPDEDLAAMDAKLGSSNLLRFMFEIADRVGPLEHLSDDGNPGLNGGVAPEQADAVLSEKQKDADWRAKAKIEGSAERKEYDRLTRLAAQHRSRQPAQQKPA